MKRIVSLILLLAAVFVVLPACAQKPAEESETTIKAAASESTPPNDPGLPDMDFQGAKLRTLVPLTSVIGAVPTEIYADSMNGESLNDAAFSRNSYLMEKYDFTIVHTVLKDNLNTVKMLILSGNDEYDLVVGPVKNIAVMAPNTLFYDLNELPYIDMSRDWWTQGAVTGLSIAGRNYIGVSDLMLDDKQRTFATMFNKSTADNLGIGNLYELVDEGGWTIEKMEQMIRLAAHDNGDGKIGLDDTFGMASEHSSFITYLLGCGVRPTLKDQDDIPVLTLYSEKTIDVIDRVLGFFCDKSLSAMAQDYKDTDYWDTAGNLFKAGRVLFVTGPISWAQDYIANSTVDTGVLPLPKYDEAQAEYITMTQYNHAHSFVVPLTAKNTEMIGFLIEVLSAASREYVMPEYYAKVKSRYVLDNDTPRMLDIIFGNVIYDVGLIYNWGGLSAAISTNLISQRANTFASEYAMIEKVIKNAMNLTIESYTNPN
jgi:hypothetical protein